MELLSHLRQSGLFGATFLEQQLERLRVHGELPVRGEALVELLVREKVLTRFQGEALLTGEGQSLLLGGKYRVLDLLGGGGGGRVYLCEHYLLRRRVAVKILPPTHAAQPGMVERFYREARAVAALDAPNILRIFDVDRVDSLLCMVMEYIDGANLHDVVSRHGPLSTLRACHYAPGGHGLDSGA